MICTDDSSLEETLHSWLIDCNDDEFVPGLAMDVFFGDFCAYLLLIKGKHRPSLEWGCGPPDSASFPAHLWLLPPALPLPPWILRSFLRLSVKQHPPFFSLTASVVLHQVRDHSLWSNSSCLWSRHIFNPIEINSLSFFHPGITHQRSKSNNNTIFRSFLAHWISESLIEVTN